MKQRFLLMMSLAACVSLGQSPNDKLVSPEVAAGGSIIYRLYAPKVTEVRLKTEGPEAVPQATPADVAKNREVLMAKDADGVWSLRMGPFPPGAYRYTFSVDA